MFFKRIFQRSETVNRDYEATLINNGIHTFNGDIKLLVIADTHGDLSINKDLCKKIKGTDYDLCCILGDISDYDFKVIFKYIPKDKIVAILGNHDRFSLLEEHGLNNYNGKEIKINGIRIGTIQGSYRYKNESFPSFNHEESIDFLKNMPEVDILLSHDKPFTYDNNDPAHDGLKGITKYLYEKRIPISVHGHNHKSSINELKNGTQVKGVYCVELLTIKDGRIVESK